jgi:hypothetical protein
MFPLLRWQFATGFCAVMPHFWRKLQDSEISEYWILGLQRGQKTVRHSEISNYRKKALRKVRRDPALAVAICHVILCCYATLLAQVARFRNFGILDFGVAEGVKNGSPFRNFELS